MPLHLAVTAEHVRESLPAATREHGLRAPAFLLQAMAAAPPAPKYQPVQQGAWPRHAVAGLRQPPFSLTSFLPRKSDAEYSTARSPPRRTRSRPPRYQHAKLLPHDSDNARRSQQQARQRPHATLSRSMPRCSDWWLRSRSSRSTFEAIQGCRWLSLRKRIDVDDFVSLLLARGSRSSLASQTLYRYPCWCGSVSAPAT